MSKKIKLGDSSTWATTEKMKEIKAAPKPAEPAAVTAAPVKKEGKTILPKWDDPPEVPGPNSGPNPNTPFVPRKAWDTGNRERYVVKYPAGYDPVTKTYTPPSKQQKDIGGPRKSVLARLGDGAKAAAGKLLNKGKKGNNATANGKKQAPSPPVETGPAKFGKAAKERWLQHFQQQQLGKRKVGEAQ